MAVGASKVSKDRLHLVRIGVWKNMDRRCGSAAVERLHVLVEIDSVALYSKDAIVRSSR